MGFDVSSRADLVGAVWDLRDRAYDNPEPWRRVAAESFFQALAEVLEAEERLEGRSDAPTWGGFAAALTQAADRAQRYASRA